MFAVRWCVFLTLVCFVAHCLFVVCRVVSQLFVAWCCLLYVVKYCLLIVDVCVCFPLCGVCCLLCAVCALLLACCLLCVVRVAPAVRCVLLLCMLVSCCVLFVMCSGPVLLDVRRLCSLVIVRGLSRCRCL